MRVGRAAGAGAGIAARLQHTFGDAFMVKMENLFAHGEVFQQRWPGCTNAQRVLIVGDDNTLCRCQPLGPVGCVLMNFTAIAIAATCNEVGQIGRLGGRFQGLGLSLRTGAGQTTLQARILGSTTQISASLAGPVTVLASCRVNWRQDAMAWG